jgi:hypothetical protein
MLKKQQSQFQLSATTSHERGKDMKKVSLLLVAVICLVVPTANILAQARSGESSAIPQGRLIFGEYDRESTFPKAEGVPGQKDPEALSLVSMYLSASGSSPWTGFDAIGTMTVGEGSSQRQIRATFSVGQRNRYRLDVTTPLGIRSVRINGTIGAVQQEDGKTFNLPAASVGAGLIPLPPTLENAAKDSRDSLLDGGLVKLDGTKLHKITFVRPLFLRSSQTSHQLADPLVTALFFDPTTHLLVKSVDAILLDTASQTQHLRVITYGDFRSIGGYNIPFRYRETVDGRLSWILELTNVTVATNHEAAYFQF